MGGIWKRGGRFDLSHDNRVEGDGVTDCTAAIQSTLAANPEGDFWIGGDHLGDVDYLITDTIEFGPNQSFEMRGGAVFRYNGPVDGRPALRFDAQQKRKALNLNVRKVARNWHTDPNDNSVGIEFRNCSRSTMYDIQDVNGFETGVSVRGEINASQAGVGNPSTAYCTFHIGMIRNNKVSLKFTTDGNPTSFINQNTFIGGQLRHDSSPNGGTNASGQIMPFPGTREVDMGYGVGNNNTFIGISMEGGVVEETIRVSNQDNIFLNCRWELGGNTTGGEIHFLPGSFANTIIGGNGLFGHNQPGPAIDGIAPDPFVMPVNDEGYNSVWHHWGIRAYSDGSFFRGDVAAFTAKAQQSPNQVAPSNIIAGLDIEDEMIYRVEHGRLANNIATKIHAAGPDGNMYTLQPPAGGGPAVWV